MDKITKPFDHYTIDYATTNPLGKDLTRIQFFQNDTKVGQLLSGSAIGPGSFVSLQDDEIFLYFDSTRLNGLLAILHNQTQLARYFVPDEFDPDREQGSEGGLCDAN